MRTSPRARMLVAAALSIALFTGAAPMPDDTTPPAVAVDEPPAAPSDSGDITPPTVAFDELPAAPFGPSTEVPLSISASDDSGDGEWSLTVMDAGATVLLQLTGPLAELPTAIPTSGLPTGGYTVVFAAQDLSGNAAEPLTRSFTVDATAPAVLAAEHRYGTDGVTVSLTFSEPIDPASLPDWPGADTSFTRLFTADATATVTFADLAGNPGTIELTVTMDVVAPELTVTVPTGPHDGTITLSGTARDALAGLAGPVRVQLLTTSAGGTCAAAVWSGDAAVEAGAWAVDADARTLPDGRYCVAAQATDLAGNVGTRSAVWVAEAAVQNPPAPATASPATPTPATPRPGIQLPTLAGPALPGASSPVRAMPVAPLVVPPAPALTGSASGSLPAAAPAEASRFAGARAFSAPLPVPVATWWPWILLAFALVVAVALLVAELRRRRPRGV